MRGESRLEMLDEGEWWSAGIGLETVELVAVDGIGRGVIGGRVEWWSSGMRRESSAWCARTSSSEIESSQSRTERNSRSMRPMSRLPKIPVHIAQWMFFRLLSLVYYRPGELKILDKGDKSTYLGRNDQGTEEDPLVCPLLESDVEMGAGAVEVGEGGEDHR